MRTDFYTKAALTCIAIFLAALVAGEWSGHGADSVNASSSSFAQQWEYKRLNRSIAKFSDDYKIVDDDVFYEDGDKLSGSHTMSEKLAQLGRQGWELVNCHPVSGLWSGDIQFAVDNPSVRTALNGKIYGSIANGVTNQVACYFKRPKR